MMMRVIVLGLSLLLCAVLPATAGDKPTKDVVMELTLRAATLVKTDGIDQAREKFHSEGEFKFGEIYVNVIDYNGTWLVYPPHPKNEGKSVLNVKDSAGKLLVQDIIKTAQEQGEGWVEYQWLNPATNMIQPKITYVKNVQDHKVIVYVGLYR